MRKLLVMFVILSMIFLSGCQSRPDALIENQKFVAFHFVEINGKKFIDPDLSLCLEREYKYSLGHLGALEKFREIPFHECDRLTGYAPLDYVEVHKFLDWVREEINRYE